MVNADEIIGRGRASMQRVVRILCVGSLIYFWAFTGASAYYVEYDLDGTLGNGPDLVSVEVSDLINVDVWVLGGPMINLIGWGIEFCNSDGSLELQGVEYHTPEGWTDYDPVEFGAGCWQINTVTFNIEDAMSIPSMVGTLTWHAAVDQSIDDLTHDFGVWVGTAGNDGFFDEGIGCTVMIGTTATESATWGAIKGLFR